MSSAIRKIERNVILTKERKESGNTSGFSEAWTKNKEQKPKRRNTNKKKQYHADSKEQCFSRLKAFKEYVATLKEQREEELKNSSDVSK